MRMRTAILASLLLVLPLSGPAAAKQASWQEPTTGMEFLWVPGGCFQMGDTFGAQASDEKPAHEVCVDGFWLGKFPVTQGQWAAVMPDNPSRFKASPQNPVDSISWDDAKRYVAKLNGLPRGGGGFRLPTEAEWEYACRSGGRHEMYPGGMEVGRAAWHAGNSGGATHPVGGKEPNGLGLFDMGGNVFQWVEDMYEKDAYARHARANPLHTTGWGRVARGGHWGGEVNSVRCTFRCYQSDRCKPASTGVRLARSAPAP